MLSTIFKTALNSTIKSIDGNTDAFINAIANELQIKPDALKKAFINNMLIFSNVPQKDIEKEKKKVENEEKKRQKELEKEEKKRSKELEKERKKIESEEKKRQKEADKKEKKKKSKTEEKEIEVELDVPEEMPMFDETNEYWKLKNVTINGKKMKYHENTEFLLTIDEVSLGEPRVNLEGILLNKVNFIPKNELNDDVLQLASNAGIIVSDELEIELDEQTLSDEE
jgi:Skp family chaperone for outer membrane proteins